MKKTDDVLNLVATNNITHKKKRVKNKLTVYGKIKKWIESHDIAKELFENKTFRNIAKKTGFDENYLRIVLKKETGKPTSYWYSLAKKRIGVSDDDIPTRVPFSCLAKEIKKDCVSCSKKLLRFKQTSRAKTQEFILQKETRPRTGYYCNNINIIIRNYVLNGCENCEYYDVEGETK